LTTMKMKPRPFREMGIRVWQLISLHWDTQKTLDL
jgi:hypothetical protein